MKTKLISGILCLIIGAGLLIYGFHGKQQMEQARKDIASAEAPKGIIPDNPITAPIEKKVTEGLKQKYYREVDSYEPYVTMLFIGGGVFLLAGVALLFFSRKR